MGIFCVGGNMERVNIQVWKAYYLLNGSSPIYYQKVRDCYEDDATYFKDEKWLNSERIISLYDFDGIICDTNGPVNDIVITEKIMELEDD